MCWDWEGTSGQAWGGSIWGDMAVDTWGMMAECHQAVMSWVLDGVVTSWVPMGLSCPECSQAGCPGC